MKILYVTTIGTTMGFFKSFIGTLLKEGHTVDIATNNSLKKVPDCYSQWGCRIFSLSCSRTPFSKGNLSAIGQIRRLVEQEQYDIVHCHTPIAAACTRLACRKLRKKLGVKVFYTAHGFHFFKGAPIKNWLLFYPMEKLCAHYTDKLITINQEDYNRAKRKMKAKEVCYVPGVGVDFSRFQGITVDRAAKRRELGLPENGTILLSVGELNENKNHQTVIRALAQMQRDDLYYMIAGVGTKEEELKDLAACLGLADQVQLLGYRSDVPELCYAADLFCFPSFREGLPVSLMEAMGSGLPCVASRIRGNTDLLDSEGGAFFDPHSVEQCRCAILEVLSGDRVRMGQHNIQKTKVFSAENVLKIMKTIYSEG